jgi:hypothetical protein
MRLGCAVCLGRVTRDNLRRQPHLGECLLAPRASGDEVRGAALRRQVHGDCRELRRRAALQEQHLNGGRE